MGLKSAWRCRPGIPLTHQHCNSRIGDTVRDLLDDRCLTASKYGAVRRHMQSHRAHEAFLQGLWLAFHFPSTSNRSCAQDIREVCYIATPNGVLKPVRVGRR